MNTPMRYLGCYLGLSGCVSFQRSVVGRVSPQGFKTLAASSSWNPWNGRIYSYPVQCDDASPEFR